MGALAGSVAGGGQRAAGRPAGGLAGGRGCTWLAAPRGSQRPQHSGLLAGEEATWQLPLRVCLLRPPCLSISLSFVVHRRPSRLSGPSPPPRTSLELGCRPPSARSAPPCLSPSLPVSGPLLLPTPSSLPDPSTPALNVVSVCLSARGACQATGDDEAGMAHPSAWPSRAQLLLQEGGGSRASRVNGCCWRAPFASHEGLGPQLPRPPSPAQSQTAGNWRRP